MLRVSGLGRDSVAVDELTVEPMNGSEIARPEQFQLARLRDYTSGSTGTATKGVEIEHPFARPLHEPMVSKNGVGADDSIVAVTSASFDISVLRDVPARLRRREDVVAGPLFGSRRTNAFRTAEVGRSDVVPGDASTWGLLVKRVGQDLQTWSAWCGGERMLRDYAEWAAPRCRRFINIYGRPKRQSGRRQRRLRRTGWRPRKAVGSR